MAENYQNYTPYHFAKNTPTFYSDPSGLFSTVVNKDGVVTDHKDDDDANIYLGSRNGPVVGQEEEGKEYKKGDKIFTKDLIVDTYFELIVKEVEAKENVENHLKRLENAISTIERITRKIQRGEPLSIFDKLALQSAMNRKDSSTMFINMNIEELKAISYLLNKYEHQWSWTESGKMLWNSLVNYGSSKIPFRDWVKSAEIPDGSGETLKGKTIDEIRNKVKTSPSNMLGGIKVHGQQLPLTLIEAKFKLREKKK